MESSTRKGWARSLKSHTYALYLAARHPAVPLPAKLLAGFVAAYALSPIDLIPDFIPVIGYLDDLILVPLGIWLAIRLVPPEIWRECLALAEQRSMEGRSGRIAAVVIIILWLIALAGGTIWLWQWFNATGN